MLIFILAIFSNFQFLEPLLMPQTVCLLEASKYTNISYETILSYYDVISAHNAEAVILTVSF
jgi:hypothetical protein